MHMKKDLHPQEVLLLHLPICLSVNLSANFWEIHHFLLCQGHLLWFHKRKMNFKLYRDDFQAINAFSNAVNDVLSRWQWAIQNDNPQYKQKKWQMSWKKNWTLSLRSTKESTVSQKSKPNFSAIRVLFLLNFWKSRKCALN